MEADLLAELRGLHHPPATPGNLISDGAIALALGVLGAWLVVKLITTFSTREFSPEKRALQRLAAIKQIDGDKGLAARARLLLDFGSDLPDGEGDTLQRVDDRLDGFLAKGNAKALRQALYRPGVVVDLAAFDDDLASSLRRAIR